jgi:acetyl-CoA carboxylase biotin carboxylase subunit
VHGKDRADCLARLRGALAALKIAGIATTVPLHQALATDPEVAASRYHTRVLEHWLQTVFAPAQGGREEAR